MQLIDRQRRTALLIKAGRNGKVGRNGEAGVLASLLEPMIHKRDDGKK